ncbi:MAG: phosphopantetheine-binding protein [Oscillospiraceae bacterium]|nr:phosphopantetheine-binding protein [Oscillospiraceae bacterium]
MLDKIIPLISKYSGVPADEINENTNLLSDLKMESMNFIDMVCEFEETFSRKIPERDFRKFITVKKIAAYFSTNNADSAGKSSGKPAENPDGDDALTGFSESHCIVSPMTGRLAERVPALVESVYGLGYPATYLYNPEEFQRKADNGDIYPYIAINGEGKATGMISLIRLPVNPRAFELGQLMVSPEYRGTNVAELLISCISKQELKFGVIYSESVTGHKFSQRSCIAGGFRDTALKIGIMPSYEKGVERVSCVVSCIERGEIELWAYLPEMYKNDLSFSLEGLGPRIIRNASDIAPNNPTTYVLNEDELVVSQYVIATFTEIGCDVEESADKLDKYAVENGVKSLVVNIPLACPHNGAAVNALRSRGFIYGGSIPRWFPDSDALMMQKLYSYAPEWDKIKLFSEQIQTISERIKKDAV